MIRINLLSEKKKKAAIIPIGGLVMGFWILTCAGLLYYGTIWVEKEKEAYFESKGIEQLEREIKKMDGDFNRLRNLKAQRNSVDGALSDYQSILSKKTGSWTKIMYRFEEFIAKAKTVWLTQLRVDQDGQVQLGAISMASETNLKGDDGAKLQLTTKGVTDLVKILQGATDVVQNVNLSTITHDVLDKEPVAKFDLTFTISKD